MKKRKAILLVVLFLVCTLSLFASSSETKPDLNDKENQEATFLIQAFKRSSSAILPEGNTMAPHSDTAPTVKIIDSLSTVLGTEPQLSDRADVIKPVNMDKLLDDFFNNGIHVAMLTVSGVAGYGSKTKSSDQKHQIIPDSKPTAKQKYAPHIQSITVKATPLSIKSVTKDKDGNVTSVTADTVANTAFVSEKGDKYPVEVYFKTSKLITDELNHRPIIKDPSKEIWYGGKAIEIWDNSANKIKLSPYAEYKLFSKAQPSSNGSPATLTLEFWNNTVYQKITNTTSTNIKDLGLQWETQFRSNIFWTAENQLWIKGNKEAFDILPEGTYRMVLKIDVMSI